MGAASSNVQSSVNHGRMGTSTLAVASETWEVSAVVCSYLL